MEKIWLTQYPEGIAHEIDPCRYQSLSALLQDACRRYANKRACSSFGTAMTYAQLDKSSLAFANYCQQELNLKKGERIALMMPNCLQYPIAILGALRAGLVVVNVNPLYTVKECRYQLRDAGTRAIVVLENFAHIVESTLADCQDHHVIVTQLGDCVAQPKGMIINFISRYIKKIVPAWVITNAIPFKKVIAEGQRLTTQEEQITTDDLAFLQYTGGTTGVAKGAMLTHGNMVANVLQANAWIAPFTEEGKEIIVTALPLYHIFSLTVNLLTFMMCGSENVLITNPRDMNLFVRLIKNLKFTAITGVNTLFNGLLNHPQFAQIDFSRLHISLGGGMAVQSGVAKRWHTATNTLLLEAYGLTETSPAVCANPLNLQVYNGAVGLPLPNTDIRIVDEDKKDVVSGESGELWVKGPQVMKGYWQNPEETAKVLHDGWFATGDIVSIDREGYIRIVDRKKDMIIVSGFNVYPNEVENVIASCPGVAEVGVVGEPDAETGEIVSAYIVRNDPQLTEAFVLSYCRKELTGYKIPKKVQFCSDLPKTPVGKILRRALRSLAAE